MVKSSYLKKMLTKPAQTKVINNLRLPCFCGWLRDACKSILTFLSDVFDLVNSSSGKKYRPIVDAAILPRGAALTRILIACLAGALPSSRLDEVNS